MTCRNLSVFIAVALSAFTFSGCSSTGPNYANVNKAWSTGDIATAHAELEKDATPENVDAAEEPLLWELDAGLMAGLNGNYARGYAWLDSAKMRISDQSFNGEEKDFLTWALSMLDGGYELRAHEALMIPVVQAYNFLGNASQSEKKPFAADIRETSNLIADVFSHRLEEIKERSRKPLTIPVPINGGEETEGSEISFVPGEASDIDVTAALGVYKNPFAFWLGGAMLMNSADDREDFDMAAQMMRSAKASGKKSRFLTNEHALAEAAARNPDFTAAREKLANTPTTYVIYEGGRAPAVCGEPYSVKIPEPVSVAATALIDAIGQLGSAGTLLPTEGTAYLPAAASRGSVPALTIEGKTPEVLVDFDSVLAECLKTEVPGSKMIATIGVSWEYLKRVGALLGAGMILQQAAESGNQFAVMAAEAGVTQAMEYAKSPIELSRPDSRTWSFLPRTLSVVKLETPESGYIDISGEEIEVPASGVNFVRIRKVDEYWPATIQVFPLNSTGDEDVPVTRLSALDRPMPMQ